MNNIFNAQSVHQLLAMQITEAVEADLKEVADEACQELRKRIMNRSDRLALALLAEYSVRENGHNITITVKKGTPS